MVTALKAKGVKKEAVVRVLLVMAVVALFCGCISAAAINATDYGGATATSRTFPWTAMLMSLVNEMTGPLPRIFGVLGIIACAIALFAGNGGAGTQKFILLIFTISIALFAPTFIKWLDDSASDAGITVAEAAAMIDVIKAGL